MTTGTDGQGAEGRTSDVDARGAPDAERRRIVLHPRTALVRRQDRARAFGGHVRGYTVDTEDVMGLVREQRRLAVGCFLAILLPLVAFAVALLLVPAIGSWRPLGAIPFPWLALGPIALFSIALVAYVHERRADAVEERWAERRSNR